MEAFQGCRVLGLGFEADQTSLLFLSEIRPAGDHLGVDDFLVVREL